MNIRCGSLTARKWAIALGIVALIATPLWAGVRRNYIIFAASTDTTAVGMADSMETPVFTADCDQLWLKLKPSAHCRVAIQVREHGDTLAPSGAVSLNDTTKIAAFYFNHPTSTTTGGDTASYTHNSRSTSVAPDETELMVEFPLNNTPAGLKWNGPRAKWIPLRNVDNGTWYRGEYTSIRLRVLGTTGTPVITWNATLKGF